MRRFIFVLICGIVMRRFVSGKVVLPNVGCDGIRGLSCLGVGAGGCDTAVGEGFAQCMAFICV